jgi:hypothetical protein
MIMLAEDSDGLQVRKATESVNARTVQRVDVTADIVTAISNVACNSAHRL